MSSRWTFGENWTSYARLVDNAKIDKAVSGLSRLIGENQICGRRFLDIGCGSGVHAVAALRLGASRVLAVDLDPGSVSAARDVLGRFSRGGQYEVRQASVLDLEPGDIGQFGIVYSWGVLHHTGALSQAVRQSAALVEPGGLLAIAIYRKTCLCGFWQAEKRWFAYGAEWKRKLSRGAYVAMLAAGLAAKGRSFRSYVAAYRSNRGMDFWHDLDDWLGGLPYESASPAEVDAMIPDGFEPVRRNIRPGGLGLFGSACDEYVYRKR